MKGFFYDFLVFMSRVLGAWFVSLFAWIVSSGFFFLRPRVAAASCAFYRSVFPEMGRPAVLRLAWDQFHHFATVFADRVRLDMGEACACQVEGMEAFLAHRRSGPGAVFLMSHFGNWEIAARLLAREGIPLMLHLGVKAGEQIEGRQKQDLARDGVRVAVPGRDADGSAFDLLESVRVLKTGGFVSIAGDRVQRENQRRVAGRFFGNPLSVPVAPHLLAQKAGVPIFVLFTVRVRRMHYRIVLRGPYPVPRADAGDRDAPLRASVDRYLAELESMVRAHPDHWYRFEPA